MAAKNNNKKRLFMDRKQVPHYSLRKLSIGVASVLLGTTFYLGTSTPVHADVANPSDQVADQSGTNQTAQTKVVLKATQASNTDNEKTGAADNATPAASTPDSTAAKQVAESKTVINKTATNDAASQTGKTDNVTTGAAKNATPAASTPDSSAAKQIAENKMAVNKTAANDVASAPADPTTNSDTVTRGDPNAKYHLTIHMVDKTGKVVATYISDDEGKVGQQIHVNSYYFKKAMPKHYYIADPNFKLPSTYTITDDPNQSLNIEIASTPAYTLVMHDKTTGKDIVTDSWDGIDDKLHLNRNLADLQAWQQREINEQIYTTNSQIVDDPDTNLSNYPVDMDLIDPIVPITALPTTNISHTYNFRHHIYTIPRSIPLWDAPAIQLTDEGMQALLNAFKTIYADPRYKYDDLNILTDNVDYMDSAKIFMSGYAEYFKGAKWTAGGLIESPGLNGSADWNAFVTHNSGYSLLGPLYQRPDYLLDDKDHEDVLYLTPEIKEQFAKYKQDHPDDSANAIIAGKLPRLNYSFTYDPVNYNVLDLKVNGGQDLSEIKIPAGYHANVLVPIAHKDADGNDYTEYKTIRVDSNVLRTSKNLMDYINQICNTSGAEGTILDALKESLYPQLMMGTDGKHYYNISGDADLQALSSFKNETEQNVANIYSPAYYEAMQKAYNESKSAYSANDNVNSMYDFLFRMDKNFPIAMMYTLSADDQTVTVNFVDQYNNTLGTQTVSGKTDETTTINYQVPDGYFVNNHQNRQEYTFAANNQPVTVHVTKKTSQTDDPTTSDKDVLNIIKYVDQDGNVVKTDHASGKAGDPIEVTIPAGYHVEGGSAPSLTIDPQRPVQTVNIIKDQHTYEPTTIADDVLNIIRYVGEDGNVLKTDHVTGKAGDPIEVAIPAGYHTADGTVPTLTIDPQNPVHIINVAKDQHDTGKPTTDGKNIPNVIKYVDKDGKVVRTVRVTGKPGDTIKLHLPDGYRFKDGQAQTIFITKDGVQIVNIIKLQAALSPDMPNSAASKAANRKALAAASTKQARKGKQSANQLPQTGNKSVAIAGLALLGLAGLIGLSGFKKRRD